MRVPQGATHRSLPLPAENAALAGAAEPGLPSDGLFALLVALSAVPADAAASEQDPAGSDLAGDLAGDADGAAPEGGANANGAVATEGIAPGGHAAGAAGIANAPAAAGANGAQAADHAGVLRAPMPGGDDAVTGSALESAGARQPGVPGVPGQQHVAGELGDARGGVAPGLVSPSQKITESAVAARNGEPAAARGVPSADGAAVPDTEPSRAIGQESTSPRFTTVRQGGVSLDTAAIEGLRAGRVVRGQSRLRPPRVERPVEAVLAGAGAVTASGEVDVSGTVRSGSGAPALPAAVERVAEALITVRNSREVSHLRLSVGGADDARVEIRVARYGDSLRATLIVAHDGLRQELGEHQQQLAQWLERAAPELREFRLDCGDQSDRFLFSREHGDNRQEGSGEDLGDVDPLEEALPDPSDGHAGQISLRV